MFHQVVPETDPEQSDSTNKICRRVFTQPGSKADIEACLGNVRFTPNSGHIAATGAHARSHADSPKDPLIELHAGRCSVLNVVRGPGALGIVHQREHGAPQSLRTSDLFLFVHLGKRAARQHGGHGLEPRQRLQGARQIEI